MKKRIKRVSTCLAATACVALLILPGCTNGPKGTANAEDAMLESQAEGDMRDHPSQDFGQYPEEYVVTFLDHDGAVLSEVRVPSGTDAPIPIAPERDGYIFAGWEGNYRNVAEDTTVRASYAAIDSPNIILLTTDIEEGFVKATVKICGEVRFCTFQTLLDYDENVLRFVDMKKYNDIEGRDADLNGNSVITMAYAGFDNLTNEQVEHNGLLLEIVFEIIDSDCGNTTLSFLQEYTYLSEVFEDGSYGSVEYTLTENAMVFTK